MLSNESAVPRGRDDSVHLVVANTDPLLETRGADSLVGSGTFVYNKH
jgi:hypothetical protein